MRVCWDANRLVSAFIVELGVSGQVLAHARTSDMETLLSRTTLAELAVVLTRPHIHRRYRITQERIDRFLQGLREFAIIAPGSLEVDAVANDPNDNHVIAAAIESGCEYVVRS